MRRAAGAGAALALLGGLTAAPARAQLTFPGASPIAAGNVIVRAQPGFTQLSGGIYSFVDKSVLIYGASPSLAFILQNNSFVATTVPVAGGGTKTAAGLGDTVLETRYTIFRRDGVGTTLRLAPYVGIVFPTGMDDANPGLSRASQPGTGAWATRDALTLSYQTLTWNGGAEAGYQANASAGGYHFGNTFFADVGAHYLLWPSDLEGPVPAELYASLEANYTSTAANRAGGGKVPGTGAQLLVIDPGIIYTRANYSLSLTGFLPAYNRVRDGAARFRWGATVFLRLSFFTSHHW